MSIKANFKPDFDKQTKIEQEVKSLVEGLTDKINLVYYIVFAKQVNKLIGKYKGEVLINELKILDEIWEKRGLDPQLLLKIKLYYYPQYPHLINYFRLDISELDGPDVLA
ncbi:MAG: hypothetical protein QXO15_10445 [Nitrososphaerota archaeon]